MLHFCDAKQKLINKYQKRLTEIELEIIDKELKEKWDGENIIIDLPQDCNHFMTKYLAKEYSKMGWVVEVNCPSYDNNYLVFSDPNKE